MQDVSSWPNICSLCLSVIVFLLSLDAENYLRDWPAKFIDISIFHNSGITIIHLIATASLSGTICQIYQCLRAMDKLSSVVMLLWASLFAINNFEILTNFKSKVHSFKLIIFFHIFSIIYLFIIFLASSFCIYYTIIFSVCNPKFVKETKISSN